MSQVSAQILKNKGTSFKIIKLHLNSKPSITSKKETVRLKNTDIDTTKTFKNSTNLKETIENVENPPFSVSVLFKPFLFTVAFSSVSLAGAAIWQYENYKKKANLLMKKHWFTQKLFTYEKKKNDWKEKFKKTWNQLHEGEKLFAPICLINVLIYLAWKVKKFQPTMIKYFSSNVSGEAVCWPLVLSTFSHFHLFHLLVNMEVLYSFSKEGVEVVGKEQFLGLYLAAGVISSFTSYVFRAIRSKNSLSLGASGAIMAIVALFCASYPEAKLSILYLSGITFSAGNGLKAMMALDTLGVLRGWSYFDHAAHLGGAFCGLGWLYWGSPYIWQKKEPLLQWWHEIRSGALK